MTNMNIWPKSIILTIETPKITSIPGRPSKNIKKDSDEPYKKKFGKAKRKGRKITYFICKTIRHNKKACPTFVCSAIIFYY